VRGSVGLRDALRCQYLSCTVVTTHVSVLRDGTVRARCVEDAVSVEERNVVFNYSLALRYGTAQERKKTYFTEQYEFCAILQGLHMTHMKAPPPPNSVGGSQSNEAHRTSRIVHFVQLAGL